MNIGDKVYYIKSNVSWDYRDDEIVEAIIKFENDGIYKLSDNYECREDDLFLTARDAQKKLDGDIIERWKYNDLRSAKYQYDMAKKKLEKAKKELEEAKRKYKEKADA